MAYLNYHPKDASKELAPRLELVAEEGEDLESVKAKMLFDVMGVFSEGGGLNYNFRGVNQEHVARALGELVSFATSSPSDLPMRLAINCELDMPLRDARSGQLLEEIETKDGEILKTHFGVAEGIRLTDRVLDMYTQTQPAID